MSATEIEEKTISDERPTTILVLDLPHGAARKVIGSQQAPAIKAWGDPFYGQESLARLCARFITHLFACPEYPPAATHRRTKLHHFIAHALYRAKVHTAVTFATLILLQRLKAHFPTACGSSGHRLFISAFMIASKVMCDDTYSNKSWCAVAQMMFSQREINQMEREMCGYLDWELGVDNLTLHSFEKRVLKDFSQDCSSYPNYPLTFVSKRVARAAAALTTETHIPKASVTTTEIHNFDQRHHPTSFTASDPTPTDPPHRSSQVPIGLESHSVRVFGFDSPPSFRVSDIEKTLLVHPLNGQMYATSVHGQSLLSHKMVNLHLISVPLGAAAWLQPLTLAPAPATAILRNPTEHETVRQEISQFVPEGRCFSWMGRILEPHSRSALAHLRLGFAGSLVLRMPSPFANQDDTDATRSPLSRYIIRQQIGRGANLKPGERKPMDNLSSLATHLFTLLETVTRGRHSATLAQETATSHDETSTLKSVNPNPPPTLKVLGSHDFLCLPLPGNASMSGVSSSRRPNIAQTGDDDRSDFEPRHIHSRATSSATHIDAIPNSYTSEDAKDSDSEPSDEKRSKKKGEDLEKDGRTDIN
ncbi:hypothetical protein NMY22_g9286 [Coprinellus aureogranulatus]|nr:hypothetical protein NMY22_g9286 [Coprinellus aureogranulatus]